MGDVGVPVYAGVLVVASAGMARHLTIPGLTVPPDLVARLETDRNAGVDAACDLVVGIRDSGAFDGVHLIPVARYREVAARLERVLGRRVAQVITVGMRLVSSRRPTDLDGTVERVQSSGRPR